MNVRSGRGASHSYQGRGPIELCWVREVRAPIIHELTHVLAGYTAANGHWTQEGFASIETYGTEKFLRLYDRPFEAIDFNALYGRPAQGVIDDWLKFVTDLPGDDTTARSVFQSMRGGRR